MASAPYLIFGLHGSLYAVTALAVCEIISLPELTPLPESPAFVAGVINLRGKVVPIIDLNARLGYSRQSYQTSDSVIILEDGSTPIGIIVNEVRRVQSIASEHIEALPASSAAAQTEESEGHFLNGIAKVDAEIILLLHLENLLRLPEYSLHAQRQEEPPITSSLLAARSFCPAATPEDKAVFHARAESLRQPLASEDIADLIPLAVIGLNGEYFGIDLKVIREFSALRTITPVPCCPQHVVGQMNLRGDILTLVDIRAALNMPFARARNGESGVRAGKVVVVQSDASKVGVLVDEVFDVMNLQPSKIRAVQSRSAEYLKGTALCGGKMLSILDLPKVLMQGALMVNEEV